VHQSDALPCGQGGCGRVIGVYIYLKHALAGLDVLMPGGVKMGDDVLIAADDEGEALPKQATEPSQLIGLISSYRPELINLAGCYGAQNTTLDCKLDIRLTSILAANFVRLLYRPPVRRLRKHYPRKISLKIV